MIIAHEEIEKSKEIETETEIGAIVETSGVRVQDPNRKIVIEVSETGLA